LKSVVAIFFLVLGCASRIVLAGELSVESAVEIAIRKNKELSSARLLVNEALSRARNAGVLSNPELEMEVAGGQDFEGRVMAGITQRFPLTARLRLERQLSDLDVKMADLEVQVAEWKLILAVRRSFYIAAAAHEAHAISLRQVNLADALAKSVAEGVNAGFRSELDLLEANLSASAMRAKSETFKGAEIEATGRLNELLARPADTPLIIDNPLTLPKSVPAAKAAGRRADSDLAELALRSGETDVALSKASQWEDVGVGIFIEGERFRDEPTGIEPETLAGLKVSVPLPFWQTGTGKAAEKEAVRLRLSAQCEALRFSIKNQILLAYRLVCFHFESASQFREKVVSSALESVRQSEAAFARSEIEIHAVFRAYDRLSEVELSALDAKKGYFLAYADWLSALGTSPTHP
jgi:cobalt-zinc-cadmium efflux system outer membrane protein